MTKIEYFFARVLSDKFLKNILFVFNPRHIIVIRYKHFTRYVYCVNGVLYRLTKEGKETCYEEDDK